MLKSPTSQPITLHSQARISPRTGASLVSISSTQLLLFGGASFEEGPSNELFLLDLETSTCHPIQSSSSHIPSPRYDHFAGLSSKGMIVFGGADSNKCFSDTWLFNLENHTWSMFKTTGETPTPRTSREAALISERHLYVCGGGTEGNAPVSTMQVYDLDLNCFRWRACSAGIRSPTPRLGHSVHWANPTSLMVYGGMAQTKMMNDVWEYDVKRGTWHLKEVKEGMSGHASVTINDTVWLTGGLTPQLGISNHIVTYSLAKSESEHRGTLPVPRVDHSLVQRASSNQLVMFGGMDHSGVYNDIHLINTEDT